jgi:hypothetical protein
MYISITDTVMKNGHRQYHVLLPVTITSLKAKRLSPEVSLRCRKCGVTRMTIGTSPQATVVVLARAVASKRHTRLLCLRSPAARDRRRRSEPFLGLASDESYRQVSNRGEDAVAIHVIAQGSQRQVAVFVETMGLQKAPSPGKPTERQSEGISSLQEYANLRRTSVQTETERDACFQGSYSRVQCFPRPWQNCCLF